MNLAILDGILHGALKPAFIGKLDPKTLAGFIRLAKSFKPSKLNDLCGQQAALLHHFPNLTSQIEEYPSLPIEQLPFESEIPEPQTLIDQFFWLLISNEIILRYNSMVLASVNWKHPIDQEYQVMKALRDLKVLAQQANEEWNENKQLDIENELAYPLMVLKLQSIALYFSLQETFKQYLKSTITHEDFYTLELLELPQNITSLNRVVFPDKGFNKSIARPDTLKFDFNGNKQKLASVIFQLCQEINLINAALSTQKDLNEILTCKKIVPGKIKIYLDCETTQFRHVIDRFKPFFKSLTLVNIEKSNSFYTKDGGELKAGNLRSSKVPDCKQKKEIDQIINQLQ